MKSPRVWLALVVLLSLLVLAAWFARDLGPAAPVPAPPAAAAPGAHVLETAHYTLTATATPAQARQVADAVEHLHRAYFAFFGLPPAAADAPKLQLRLYRDRDEFIANNVSRPWAEAFYLKPVCHAYFSAGAPNPYHWMLHEAVHQLRTERTSFLKAAWSDEGLATYFGTSLLGADGLQVGVPDANAYPIWWLGRLPFSGDLDADLAAGRVIPLRAIVSGRGGPAIADHVNLYYVQYWSLTHFLFHHEGGRHAAAYRQLITEGATLENFERLIGPVEEVQAAWYAHLMQRVQEHKANG